MFMKHVKFLAEARQVVRPVCLSMVAMAIVASVMAFEGWSRQSLIPAVGMLIIAGLLIYQVYWAFSQLRGQSNQVSQSASEAERHYADVLWRIVRYVEGRDAHREGHSDRVSELTYEMAVYMKLPKADCEQLRIAGRLHDVGMLAVSDKVLNQRGRMGVDGFRTVQKHPEVGYELLRPLTFLTKALPAIRYHHERMNGTGYPMGLSEMEIPLAARILAVADAYDAMTHDRPYRTAMTPMAAMQELKRCSPAGYDPDCIAALAELKHLTHLEKAMNNG